MGGLKMVAAVAALVVIFGIAGSRAEYNSTGYYALEENQVPSGGPEVPLAYSRNDRSLRSSRLFPFFTIIRFTNEVCKTTSEDGGICYTRKQCTLLGGTAQGSCAQGLGVCCQFIATCGTIVTQNGTLFRNPNYPSAYQLVGGTNVCQLRIRKPLNVCQVRLNFIKFDIDGPVSPGSGTGTAPQDVGVCKTDQLTVTSAGATVPTLCGTMAGQHMYVDFGSSDTITMNLLLSGNVQRDRTWDVEILTIPCNSINRAPTGCLQYFTGVSGQVESFNSVLGNGVHLANQDYSVCVRMEDGMRSIEWTGCNTASVRVSGPAPPATAPALAPITCPTPLPDYLIIPGGIQSPFPTAGGATAPTLPTSMTDRFCDAFFFAAGSGVRSTVKPFIMHFRSDGTEVAGAAEASAGFCLKWQQSPNT